MTRFQEIKEELASVFSGRGVNWIDSALPVLVFLVLNGLLDQNAALVSALLVSSSFLVYRAVRREKLIYSLAGLAGVGLAAGFALLSGNSAGFFLPGLLSGLVTVLVCVSSVLLKKPLAAWTSMLTRRWPREWYWLDQIRPAYAEVTLLWAAAFGLRSALEIWLLIRSGINLLGVSKILLGWPYTILILVFSYLYGMWRLGTLQGPSVDEFINGQSPPWAGQKRGF